MTARERELESKRKYNASPKARAARARYMKTPAGRESLRQSKARWNRANAESVRIASYKRKLEQRLRIDAIKLVAGCADCGYRDNPAALEFDHVENNKESNVSRLLGATWIRVQAEIDKCEVVCANCHRIRTVNRIRA